MGAEWANDGEGRGEDYMITTITWIACINGILIFLLKEFHIKQKKRPTVEAELRIVEETRLETSRRNWTRDQQKKLDVRLLEETGLKSSTTWSKLYDFLYITHNTSSGLYSIALFRIPLNLNQLNACINFIWKIHKLYFQSQSLTFEDVSLYLYNITPYFALNAFIAIKT